MFTRWPEIAGLFQPYNVASDICIRLTWSLKYTHMARHKCLYGRSGSGGTTHCSLGVSPTEVATRLDIFLQQSHQHWLVLSCYPPPERVPSPFSGYSRTLMETPSPVSDGYCGQKETMDADGDTR